MAFYTVQPLGIGAYRYPRLCLLQLQTIRRTAKQNTDRQGEKQLHWPYGSKLAIGIYAEVKNNEWNEWNMKNE